VTSFAFPVVGNSGSDWSLPQSLYDELRDAYPGVKLDDELRKARAWCISNAKRRKTPRGMPKFLNSWMERNQNNTGGVNSSNDPRGTYALLKSRKANRANQPT
jgi:hypothetical protein